MARKVLVLVLVAVIAIGLYLSREKIGTYTEKEVGTITIPAEVTAVVMTAQEKLAPFLDLMKHRELILALGLGLVIFLLLPHRPRRLRSRREQVLMGLLLVLVLYAAVGLLSLSVESVRLNISSRDLWENVDNLHAAMSRSGNPDLIPAMVTMREAMAGADLEKLMPAFDPILNWLRELVETNDPTANELLYYSVAVNEALGRHMDTVKSYMTLRKWFFPLQWFYPEPKYSCMPSASSLCD